MIAFVFQMQLNFCMYIFTNLFFLIFISNFHFPRHFDCYWSSVLLWSPSWNPLPSSPPNISNGAFSLSKDIKPEAVDFELGSELLNATAPSSSDSSSDVLLLFLPLVETSELDSPFSPPNISNGAFSFNSDIKPGFFEPNIDLGDDLGIMPGDALNVSPKVEVLAVDGGVAASVVRRVDVAAFVACVVGVVCCDFDASDVGITWVSEVPSSILGKMKLKNTFHQHLQQKKSATWFMLLCKMKTFLEEILKIHFVFSVIKDSEEYSHVYSSKLPFPTPSTTPLPSLFTGSFF